MIVSRQPRPAFRFSLRDLFFVMTAAAILTCFTAWLSRESQRARLSPDDVAFWVDRFHNGTSQEREFAAGAIATFARKVSANSATLDALCEAAIDKNVTIRQMAISGLDELAKSNERASSALQRVADDDPDEVIKFMARQALKRGIN